MNGRKLTRSESDRRIAGVCGGIAEYFGIDPVLVRVAFVAAAIAGGFGVVLYIILWVALPGGSPGDSAPPRYGRAASAVRIAEERYARGEISAEELHQIRSDLASGP